MSASWSLNQYLRMKVAENTNTIKLSLYCQSNEPRTLETLRQQSFSELLSVENTDMQFYLLMIICTCHRLHHDFEHSPSAMMLLFFNPFPHATNLQQSTLKTSR